MKKLTHDNYFQTNKWLTNSKVGDYLKCPNYFYRKHIKGEIDKKETKAMDIGSITDELLTTDKIEKLYWVGDGRSKEAKEKKEEGYKVINEKDYNEIISIANAVEETKAYKQLKNYNKQEILQVEMKLGEYFTGIAGIPDFYKYNEKTKKCIIVDLKTVRSVDSNKYYYHCLDYGYFRQQAFYQILLKAKYPDIKYFESYHLAVDKQKDIYNVRAFELAEERIDQEIINLSNIFKAIKNRKDYNKYNPSFFEAETIGEIYESFTD